MLLPCLCVLGGVLLVLPTNATKQPSYEQHLRVGAIVEPDGPVMVVEDVVDVRITLCDFQKLERLHIPQFRRQIQQAEAVLQQTSDTVHKLNHPLTLTYFSTLMLSFLNIQQSFDSLLEWTPFSTYLKTPVAHARSKRGLIDIGGRLLKGLIGTATEADVAEVHDQLDKWGTILNNQAIVLSSQNKAIETVVRTQKVIIDRLNNFTSLITQLQQVQHQYLLAHHLALMAANLRAVYLAITNFKLALQDTFTLLRDVLDGVVTPSLLTPTELMHVIDWARTEKGLTPVFSETQVQYYYPYMEATVTTYGILVHIPFRSPDMFTIYHIHPFPTVVNSSIYQLSTSHTTLLVSSDFMHIAFPADFHDCHITRFQMYLCPAYQYVFLPTSNYPCEMGLVRNSPIESLCVFTPVEDTTIFHLRVKPWRYFYFHHSNALTVTCPGSRPSNTAVHGSFVILEACSLTSHNLTTKQSNHLLLNQTFHTYNLKPFNLPAPTTPLQLKPLHPLGDTLTKLIAPNITLQPISSLTIWPDLRPDTVYPILASLTTVLTLTVILATLLICVFHRRYAFLRRAILQRTLQPATA
ncbi:uncharacterized protein LOC126994781 isoform X2 [Eriocheir sinensis]|nr:uncharacterized protein LOC126994781 isoform X2 [Eriocheir sinensis]